MLRMTGPDFAALATKAKGADKAIIRELRAAIRKAGREAVADVKSEIANIPSSGKYGTDVRGALSRGTRVSIAVARPKSAGVTIMTSASGLPAHKRPLAKAMNKEWFRHPSYGNRERWVNQKGHPYFGSVIAKRFPRMQADVWRATEQAKNAIARSMAEVEGVSGG
jgi:hypothetical protein